MTSANPYEAASRARKMLRLIGEFDRRLHEQHIDATQQDVAAEVVRQLRAASGPMWAELAKVAGCNPPSATTIAEIVAHYEARVAEDYGPPGLTDAQQAERERAESRRPWLREDDR